MNMKNIVLMAKPVGSYCNMNCSYCYYLHADNMQDFSTLRMDEAVLETMISNYLKENDSDVSAITWHGGEPTLAGIDFYQKAVELERKYLPKGKKIWNNIQTNGLLIDDEWAAFLKDNAFDVGVSVDGTGFVHDTYRSDSGGNSTYERSTRAISILQKHGIQPDLLCTVTRETAENARSVYRKLSAFNTGWIQFIPIVRRDEDGNVTDDSVTPALYGKFLKTVFQEWFFHDLGKVNVQLFAETALSLSHQKSNVCWMSETCGNVLVVEKDGSVYSCDHFVNQKHRLGCVTENSFAEMADSPFQKDFGNRKQTDLPSRCLACPYLSLCNGCCPKDRFLKTEDPKKNLYYLCEGLREYYDYAVPLLQKAMELSAKGYTSSEIMRQINK